MKTILKIILVLAICIAIFGGAKVKNWLSTGVDKSVNTLEQGVNIVKSDFEQFNKKGK